MAWVDSAEDEEILSMQPTGSAVRSSESCLVAELNLGGARRLPTMARGPKKHLKRLRAPKHWMLDKLTGIFAPRPSTGPHKMRESLPLVVFLRDRLKYALTKKECQTILMNRLVKVRPPTAAARAAGARAPRSAWRLFRSLLCTCPKALFRLLVQPSSCVPPRAG